MSSTPFAAQYSELSNRLAHMQGGGWDVHDRAMQMQREGADVILLCVGDPDFRTPEPIIDNAVSYMRVGRTHYSPALGELNLRRAVGDLETATSPWPCGPEEVAIFSGATAATYGVMSCLLNPGDEIVIPEPMYVGYPPIMKALDAKVVSVPLDVAGGFELSVDGVKAAVTDKTRVVFLNTPGNPSGSIIRKSKLREMAAWCLERDIWLVVDEVYSMFTYEGLHRSARAAANSLDNIVMIDGLSKSHAMSGWRIGWVIAPPSLIERMGDYALTTQFGCPQFIQDASAFALENDQVYVGQMRERYRYRRDLVMHKLDKEPGLSCYRPRAGMFVMCNTAGTGLSGGQFAEQLLDAEGVSTVPGDAFGPSAADYVRIGLAQDEAVLKRACKRIRRFAKSLASQ